MNETIKKMEDVQDFTDSLFYQIRLTEKYFKKFGKQLEMLLDLPISFDELSVLLTIKKHNGEIHQRDLAKIILKDRANTGRLLDALENDGYIERIETIKNKRSAKLINITQRGIDVMENVLSVIKPIFDKLNKKIPFEEQEYIKKYLIKFRKILSEVVEIRI